MTTWNASDKSSAIVLSNANLTATSVGSGQQTVRSTSSVNSGLVYWEVALGTVQTNVCVGFATAGYLLASGAGPGGDADSCGFYGVSPAGALYMNANNTLSGAAATNGEVVYFAIDFTHSKVWVSSTHMRSASTPWNWGATGTQNPATNTGGQLFSTGPMNAGPYFAIFNDSTGGAVATANFGGSAFNGTIPAGFSAWDSGSSSVTGTMSAMVKKLVSGISGTSSTPVVSTSGTTNETDYATSIFYVAEVTIARPGSSTLTITEGNATVPNATLAQFSDGATTGTSVQYVSDTGYVNQDTTPVCYPPFIKDAFQIDRKINLPPVNAAIGASWGDLNLSNIDNQYSSLVATWNNDGRNLNILYGMKTYENFDGWRSGRTTVGSYVAADNTIKIAQPNVLRNDFTSGSAVLLNEPAAVNLVPNSVSNPFGSNADSIVATSTAVPSLDGTSTIKINTCNSGTGSRVLSFFASTFTSGVVYCVSAWIWVPSGQSISSIAIGLEGGAGPPPFAVGNADLSKTNRWQRIYIANQAGSVTASRNLVIRITQSVLNSIVYVTCPQIEVTSTAGNSPTSYVATTGTIATRTADNNYRARRILKDPLYSQLKPVFKGVQSPWFLSDTALQIPLRDASYWLDRPLQTNLYTGSGTYGGTASLTGAPIPITRGGTTAHPVCNVSPVLIDPVNLIYQYNDGPGTIVNLYQGGATSNTFQADTTNLYSGSTTAGMYRTDNSRGLFQLGSTPAATMTADVTGKFPSGTAQTTCLGVAYQLLLESLLLPAAYVATTAWTAATSAYPYVGGFYYGINDTPTGIDAVNQIMFGLGAKLYPARDGTLKPLVLRAPSGAPVATFTITNSISVIPAALDSSIDPPPYRIRVGSSHNYTLQTSGLLGAATAAHTQVVALQDQLSSVVSGSVQTNYLRPNDLAPITGSLLVAADAQTVANDLAALWCTRRRLYIITVPISVGLLRDIGDIVTVIWPLDNLSSGQLGIIVGETFNSADATIEFSVLV